MRNNQDTFDVILYKYQYRICIQKKGRTVFHIKRRQKNIYKKPMNFEINNRLI